MAFHIELNLELLRGYLGKALKTMSEGRFVIGNESLINPRNHKLMLRLICKSKKLRGRSCLYVSALLMLNNPSNLQIKA